MIPTASTETDHDVGRSIFGVDVAGYEDGRPKYPEAVYAAPEASGALLRGIDAFEVGPGTGQATRRLLEAGVASLVAIEPDTRLAAYLAARYPAATVINAGFEDADLEPASFDLGIAATSFHWIDARRGLSRAVALLRPGGWWAMWWTLVHDPAGDAFSRAVLPLLRKVTLPPSLSGSDHVHWSLDVPARLAEMRAAGMVDPTSTMLEFEFEMSAKQLRALYATFSMIRRLDPVSARSTLDAIEMVALDVFGGAVRRTFRVPLYLARKPGNAPPADDRPASRGISRQAVS